MFDPEKLSPLPIEIKPWGEPAKMVTVAGQYVDPAIGMLSDDAEFFVMARRCYDIGERRGWYVYPLFQSDNRWWTVCYLGQLGKSPAQLHRAVDDQAEAMALMIEADEWLTKQETEGNSDEC